jgi:hypothetical protein
MMSTTYYEVRNAQLDEQFEAARLTGDIQRIQEINREIAAEKTLLMQAMYGSRLA